MTWRKRTIMEMARESHMDVYGLGKDHDKFVAALEQFAKLYAKYDELYKGQNVIHGVIAGALFDFMGWLTSRPKRIMLSSADEASPAVDAIKEFAKMRGLSLDDARVQDWQDITTPPAAQPAPVQKKRPVCWDGDDECPNRQACCDAEECLYTTPQPQREWVGLMRGVRVDGDTVVITVKGGNEAARKLCAELLKEKNT